MKREEQNRPSVSLPPIAVRSHTQLITMDIVKGDLEVLISTDFQRKAWSNKVLNEKVLALFSAAEAVAEEAKKLSPNTE